MPWTPLSERNRKQGNYLDTPKITGHKTSLKAGWKDRYGLPLAGAIILLLSVGAMAAIWQNIRQMEQQRYRQHENLAKNIGETAQTFILNRQYDYFFDVLTLLNKISYIDYLAVIKDGRIILQAGTQGRSAKAEPWQYPVVRQLALPDGTQTQLQIIFSLAELRRPMVNIIAAFGVIAALLGCLAWLGGQLHATHRKLVAAEQSKEHMIYSITHDAKQDLTVISGKLEFLLTKIKRGANLATIEQDLKIARESADAIDRYLNNLKDQQGLAQGRIELMFETVELESVIRAVIAGFEEKMSKRSMTVRIGQLADGVSLYTDPQVVRRVLSNLIHNSMKYSPQGGEISIWQEVRGNSVYHYVQDQGQGILPQDWERIFTPYVQLDPKREGMGLGLANARQLVKLLGGQLGVWQSTVGQGTTMYFSLPITAKR